MAKVNINFDVTGYGMKGVAQVVIDPITEQSVFVLPDGTEIPAVNHNRLVVVTENRTLTPDDVGALLVCTSSVTQLTVPTDVVLGTKEAETIAVCQTGDTAIAIVGDTGATVARSASVPDPVKDEIFGVVRTGASFWRRI